MQEILPDLYKIELPLPNPALRAVNSYLIRASDRNVMVDTGMDVEQCMTVMQSAVKKLGIDLTKTDFFITHLHLDHLGLLPSLKTNSSKVFLSAAEADEIRTSAGWIMAEKFALTTGIPEGELKNVMIHHPGRRFGECRARWRLPFDILKENEVLEIGSYRFNVVETPGHTKGHLCLFEPNRKILLSGDHILKDITPTIQSWYNDRDPLNEYLSSLDKIDRLEVALVLPGHREVFSECKKRIRQLIQHHEERIEEILSILRTGSKTPYEVASQMTWDVECDSWDEFPVLQKWFTVGEAVAHLHYLQAKGKALKESRGQTIEFHLI